MFGFWDVITLILIVAAGNWVGNRAPAFIARLWRGISGLMKESADE